MKDRLELSAVPEEEDRGHFQTLSDMMMLLTGRLPKVADAVNWEGWHFEIVDMDGKTIDNVLASRLADTEAVEDGADPARP
jgi:putative hemolysin